MITATTVVLQERKERSETNVRSTIRTILVIALLAIGGVRGRAAENLAANPSFEDGEIGKSPPKWSHHSERAEKDFPFLISEGGRAGGRCAVIDVPEGVKQCMVQQVQAVPNDLSKGLKLTAWLRSDGPEGLALLTIRVDAPKRKMSNLVVDVASLKLTGQWKEYQASLVLADGVAITKDDELNARILVEVLAPHRRVYVDDVSFSVVDAEASHDAYLEPVPEGFRAGLIDRGYESTPLVLHDGRIAVFYAKDEYAACKVSGDQGNTWGPAKACPAAEGVAIRGRPFPLRLASGALGMVVFRDNELFFYLSKDEAETWRAPSRISDKGPVSLCLNGAPMALKSERIVVPVFVILPGRNLPGSCSADIETFCWLSDDEGRTWRKGDNIVVEHGGQKMPFDEAIGVELKDGRLMSFARTANARLFKAYSSDGGETWTKPEPTPLVATFAPCSLTRMPDGNLLCIWNQSSIEEVKQTLRRHRLTCAISKDEGETWQHHRNLESLDDTVRIDDRANWDVFDMEHEAAYKQPTDKAKYPHAPGPLRCAYPAVAYSADRVIVSYDYGAAVDVFPHAYVKVRSLPYKWFSEIDE